MLMTVHNLRPTLEGELGERRRLQDVSGMLIEDQLISSYHQTLRTETPQRLITIARFIVRGHLRRALDRLRHDHGATLCIFQQSAKRGIPGIHNVRRSLSSLVPWPTRQAHTQPGQLTWD